MMPSKNYYGLAHWYRHQILELGLVKTQDTFKLVAPTVVTIIHFMKLKGK